MLAIKLKGQQVLRRPQITILWMLRGMGAVYAVCSKITKQQNADQNLLIRKVCKSRGNPLQKAAALDPRPHPRSSLHFHPRIGVISNPAPVNESGEAFVYIFLNQSAPMGKECGYHKINKQMKFEFLCKVLGQGLSIYQAAKEIGIHYSTAKTIVFFHKHRHKSYRSFKVPVAGPVLSTLRAAYREVDEQQIEIERIPIICNDNFARWEPRKEFKAGNILLTYLRSSRNKEGKQRVVRKGSKNTRRGNSGTSDELGRLRESDRDSFTSESSDNSDSEYIYTG